MQYPTEQPKQAVTAVESGALSIRKAAAQRQVPKSTIADRVSGNFGLDVKPGRKPVLPSAVEDKIVKIIKLAAEWGGHN